MWNAALDKRENEVMRALLTLSAGKARFLASPAEVLSLAGVREGELERPLSSLAQDGYVDYIATERKGEPTFVVELRPKGMAYARTAERSVSGFEVMAAFMTPASRTVLVSSRVSMP